ncbi:glycine cleavage system protein GcvH [soil metagenome]
MSDLPENLRYADSHEWIDPETGRVGISDHAQSELSDVVYVELPEVGREVEAGESVAVVESVKAASDLYAPVSGEIVEVNGALEGEPEAINADPYGAGWILVIRPASEADFGKLHDAESYQEIIG